MQISSTPESTASPAMIWITGLVSPSRSTSGNSSFCTAVEAGYCRVPRPAAVITAFRTFAIVAVGYHQRSRVIIITPDSTYLLHLILGAVFALAGAWQWARSRNHDWAFVLTAGLVWMAVTVMLRDMRDLRRRIWQRQKRCP